MVEKITAGTYLAFNNKIASVLSRIQMAQDIGAIPRNRDIIYDESIGHIIDRNNHIAQSSEELQTLRRLYGSAIDILQDPREDGIDATPIMRTLCQQSLEPGTNREVQCIVPVGMDKNLVHYSAAAVPIHSRASFIGNISEHMRTDEQQVEIGLIDLSDLRSADSPIEGSKNNPADVLINKSASAIRRAIRKIWLTDPDLYENPEKTYEIGRYGGDEFMFALVGTYTVEQRTRIVEEIQRTLAEEKGYYMKDSIWEERSIQLKKGKDGGVVEWIRLPEDPSERKVFVEYFERGLLLNPEEQQRVMRKYSPNGKFEEDLYRADYPLDSSRYPKSVKTTDEKIDYIQSQHPELAIYFDLAKIFDKETDTTLRQRTVLRLIESSIFDPLLGEAIYSRFDFQEHLSRGNFTEVMVLDLKFIKEVNEGMSYADADSAIVNLWKSIKSKIGAAERKNLYVSRFGGSFILGVRKGDGISNATRDALLELGSHHMNMFPGQSADVSVPLGSTAFSTTHSPDIKTILKNADEMFYIRLFDDLHENEMKTPGFMDQIMKVDFNELTNSPYHVLSKHELYAKFLRGKRSHERTTNIFAVLNRNSVDMMKILMLPMDTRTIEISDEYISAKEKVIHTLKQLNTTPLATS